MTDPLMRAAGWPLLRFRARRRCRARERSRGDRRSPQRPGAARLADTPPRDYLREAAPMFTRFLRRLAARRPADGRN